MVSGLSTALGRIGRGSARYVFGIYSLHNMLCSCVQEYDSVLSGMSSEIMDQAQQLLSRLLLVSMPSDGVMLLQPILCHDIERMTYMACSIVHAILTYGYRRLFISRSDLLAVEVILKDAQVVLNSLGTYSRQIQMTRQF